MCRVTVTASARTAISCWSTPSRNQPGAHCLISQHLASSNLAVFLDRDGVINQQRPDHVKSWDEFEFLPGVLDALARLHQMKVRVAVVTNQAVVGRGLIQENDLLAIHERMRATVALAGGNIERIYSCVHAP